MRNGQPAVVDVLLFLAFTLAGCSRVPSDEIVDVNSGSRPNVLFILADDLSNRGLELAETPTLDRLTAQSLTFNRAYVQFPVCGPSRASLFSGLYPESTGVLNNEQSLFETRPAVVTLPQAFVRAGYWTGAVGKVLGHKINQEPMNWSARLTPQTAEGLGTAGFERRVAPGSSRDVGRPVPGETSTPRSGEPLGEPTDRRDDELRDGVAARQIATWLDEKEHSDRPFFLYYGIAQPHEPFSVPPGYHQLYEARAVDAVVPPLDDWSDVPRRARSGLYREYGFELGKVDRERAGSILRAYLSCVSFLDAQLKVVFDALKRNGLWEKTIIVFTSDHGFHLGEHFLWGKNTLFEEALAVPLIVRVPGITPEGSITRSLVELVDLFPSLAELCDIPALDALQGTSFVSVLKDPSRRIRKTAYSVCQRAPRVSPYLAASVRTEQWRFTAWGSPGPAELYDLSSDPKAYTNLAQDADYKSIQSDLARQLRSRSHSASTSNWKQWRVP